MRLRLLPTLALLAGVPGVGGPAEPDSVFTGFITDTECGPNHAPMIAKGGMGKDDRECTLACVAKGATFGFVDEERERFFQLDDQEAPAPFAGRRVRIRGRREGDTIYVRSVTGAGKESVSSFEPRSSSSRRAPPSPRPIRATAPATT